MPKRTDIQRTAALGCTAVMLVLGTLLVVTPRPSLSGQSRAEFVANGILGFCVIVLLSVAIALVFDAAGFALKSKRVETRGSWSRCPKCKYDLAGLPNEAPCPECNLPTPRSSPVLRRVRDGAALRRSATRAARIARAPLAIVLLAFLSYGGWQWDTEWADLLAEHPPTGSFHIPRIAERNTEEAERITFLALAPLALLAVWRPWHFVFFALVAVMPLPITVQARLEEAVANSPSPRVPHPEAIASAMLTASARWLAGGVLIWGSVTLTRKRPAGDTRP